MRQNSSSDHKIAYAIYIMTIRNDQISRVKHVLDPLYAHMGVFFFAGPLALHLDESAKQSVSQLVRQSFNQTVSRASRQAWVFSMADLASSSGEHICCHMKQRSNGNAPTADV